jgi:hypothetical protein
MPNGEKESRVLHLIGKCVFLYYVFRNAGSYLKTKGSEAEPLLSPLSDSSALPQSVQDKIATLREGAERWKESRVMFEGDKARFLWWSFGLLIAAILLLVVSLAGQIGQTLTLQTAVRLAAGIFVFASAALFFASRFSSNAVKTREESLREIEYELDLWTFSVTGWERRAEKTLLEHDKRLRRYYDQNLGENNKVFAVGVACMILGLFILAGTIYAVYQLNRNPKNELDSKIIVASLGAIGSFFTNYVAAIYLKMHAAASKNLGTFHGRLVDTHQFLLANMVASRINDGERRETAFAQVATNLSKPRQNPAEPEAKGVIPKKNSGKKGSDDEEEEKKDE